MVDRLVAVDDADYRLPEPVLGALAADFEDTGSEVGKKLGEAIAAPAKVVFEGDSLTYGVGAQDGGQWLNYPAQVKAGLPAGSVTTNLATGGQTVATMLADAETQVDPHYATGFGPNRTFAVLLGGINDLYAGRSAADVYADIAAWHAGRRAVGFKTVAVTVLPATGNTPPAGLDAARLSLNAMIRSNWASFADGFADAANDPVFTAAGATLNQEYYHLDAVHLSERGYAILAGSVRAGLGAAGCPTFVGNIPDQIGEWALVRAERKPNGNTRIGYNAAPNAGPATLNTVIGQGAGALIDPSSTGNTFVGQGAATNAYQNSVNNVVIGSVAGFGATGQYLGSRGVLIGSAAGYKTTADDNTVVGYRAMMNNGIGISNAIVGSEAVLAGTAVSETIAVGYQALRAVNANYNTAIGHRAGYAPGGSTVNALVSGVQNVFVGRISGGRAANTTNAVAVGHSAQAHGTGVTIGASTLAGAGATVLGHAAHADASYGVAIGVTASADFNGAVAIGSDSTGAGAVASAANAFVLGTASHRYRMPGLPTSNPGAGSGILWNDAGTVKVA